MTPFLCLYVDHHGSFLVHVLQENHITPGHIYSDQLTIGEVGAEGRGRAARLWWTGKGLVAQSQKGKEVKMACSFVFLSDEKR